MQKSRQYSSPPQVSQQKKGTDEHFCATDALNAAGDSKGSQEPAGNGLSPHVSARWSPQPSARTKPSVNGYNSFTTDTNSAYSIPASRISQSCLQRVSRSAPSVCFYSHLETGRERDLFGSYQIGFSPRIWRNKAFIEVLFSFELPPRADNLAIYEALARFGVNFDMAMFNFDLNYAISLNSVMTTSYRTGYHQVQVNLAYVF